MSNADREQESSLRSFLLVHPEAADERYALATLLFHQNRPKESLEEFTRAAGMRRPTGREFQIVALDYVLLNDYPDADRWMTEAVAALPKDGEAWYDLGRIKYTENRFGESLSAFGRALALVPGSVKAQNNLGLALEGLGRSGEAEEAYERAIALDAGSPHRSEQPLLNLATLLVNKGDPAKALALLDRALAMDERNGKIHEQRGRALERLGRLPAAEEALKAAVALDPESSGLHFQLGQVLKKEGKDVQARGEFARVAELRGTRSDAH